jgi:hypothetical protein
MIAIDFKLTGAQVKALLRLYHETPLNWDCESKGEWPGLVLTESRMYLVVLETLRKKGLAEHFEEQRPGMTKPWAFTRLTDSGSAIVKLIVQQAHNILAIEQSARAMHAKNTATRERWVAWKELAEEDNTPRVRSRKPKEVL